MKTKMSLLFTLFLLLASCQQELPAVAGDTSKGHISFNLASMASGNTNPLDNKGFSTKTLLPAEDAVKRMDVVIFNASTGAYLSTFTQSTVDVSDFSPTFPSNTRGVACNIYFLANLKAAPAVSTFSESDFKKSNCGLATLIQSDVVTYGIPMCGSLLGCTIPSDGIITNTPITLTRLLARVDIVYSNIVPTGTLSVQSLQLCNVPSITPYYSPADIDATYYTGMVLANLDPETTTLPAVGVTKTFTYYIPANRRGSDTDLNKIDPRLKNGVGITSPTYVKISGTQVLVDNLPITYTFYLGGNSTTDYNLLANTKYTVNASIKGISDADKRVVPTKPTLQLESNCYIVAPGSTIYIPVSRAEAGNTALTVAGLTGTGFTSSSSFSAGLLWTDVSATVSATVTAEAKVDLRCIKVVVPAGATFGNSVVYAYTGTDPNKVVVWSWHIWVTDYVPGATAVATTGGTIDFLDTRYWLDRNLGATSSAPGNLSSLGLYYQWGRKDPFPGAAGVSTSAERPISVVPAITYPVSSSKITGSVAYKSGIASPITTVNQSSYSINYPLLFLTSWTGSIVDVVNSSPTVNNSWNTSAGKKSIFDPCPDGWRVPLNGSWDGLTATNFKNNPVSGSPYWGRQTGIGLNYYPASGRRYSSSGTFDNVGSNGFYWSGSVNGADGYTLFFYSGSVSPSGYFGTNDYYRAVGFAVRCVQE